MSLGKMAEDRHTMHKKCTFEYDHHSCELAKCKNVVKGSSDHCPCDEAGPIWPLNNLYVYPVCSGLVQNFLENFRIRLEFRVVFVPAASSRTHVLRTGKEAEKIQGFCTARTISQRRSHFVGVMSQDSDEVQCPEGEDHVHDDARDTLAGKVVRLRPEKLEDGDEAISSLEIKGLSSESSDSVVVTSLPSSKDGRLEELAKVEDTLSQSLLSVLEQLETLVRLKESQNCSGKPVDVADGMRKPGMRREDSESLEKINLSVNGEGERAEKDTQSTRSRMESRNRMQKRGEKRILTRTVGNKRQDVKSNEDRAAINKIKEGDERFMGAALVEAKKAALAGEVPVGAVIVQNGRIIARAYNRVESDGDPTAHAEMLCLRSAARRHGDWRLVDATLYVTLEPCPMCAGAILQSRVKGLVWGSRNTLLGADGSWVSLFPELDEENTDVESTKSEHEQSNQPFIHPFHTSLKVRRGVLADDCSTVMRSFFKARREVNGNFVKTKPRWLPLPAWVLLKRFLHWLSLFNV